MEQLGSLQLHLRWIPSHLDESLLENPFEDWVHLWNGRVDALVGHYNLNRPADFQELWMSARRYHHEVSQRLKQLSIFFGKVAALPKPTTVLPMGDVQIVPDTQPALQDFYTDEIETVLLSYHKPPGKLFTISFLTHMLHWLISCADENDDDLVWFGSCTSAAFWISFLECHDWEHGYCTPLHPVPE